MSDGVLQRTKHSSKYFCQGWLDHKGHAHSGGKWRKLWLVLQGNIIYIFNDNSEQQDTHIGCLTVDSKSVFALVKGDSKKGYKFDLTTDKRFNRFRTTKKSERELWRGYIVGLVKGAVPTNLDLLPRDVEKITEDLEEYRGRGSRRSHWSDESIESGVVADVDTFSHTRSAFTARTNTSSHSPSHSQSSGSATISGGGPIMRHIFFPGDDKRTDVTVPSWFLTQCSREIAEKILTESSAYGNTLMRESSTHKQHGSYVIVRRTQVGDYYNFNHFEVIRTAEGYKLKVEDEHAPMKYLSEVMDYFIKTAGATLTHPLTTNDRVLLGLEEPNYATRIHTAASSPPAEEEFPAPAPVYGNTNPEEWRYYEEPARVQTERPKTYGFSSRPQSQDIPDSRRSQPAPGHRTVAAGPRYNRPGPSLQEMEDRHHESAGLQQFDDVIADFEEPFIDNIYINTQSYDDARTRQVCPPSPPPPLPPPAPHMKVQAPRYVNEPAEQMQPAVAAEPMSVAPPPPPSTQDRDKLRQEGSASDRSLANQLSNVKLRPTNVEKKIPPKVKPKPVLKASADFSAQSARQVSMDQASLQRVTFHKSESSPGGSLARQSLSHTRERNGSQPEQDTVPTIDDQSPGGVGTLRGIFLKNTSTDSPGNRHHNVPVGGFGRKSQSFPQLTKATFLAPGLKSTGRGTGRRVSNEEGNQAGATKEGAPYRSNRLSGPFTNNRNKLTPANPSPRRADSMTSREATNMQSVVITDGDDSIYDDTANPSLIYEDTTGNDDIGNVNDGLSAMDPTQHTLQNPAFRSKLADIVSHPRARTTSGPGLQRPESQEDQVYEEIKPDALYYANEEFNTN